MRYCKYVYAMLLSLNVALLYGNTTDCINPNSECPEPTLESEKKRCHSSQDSVYEDYAWYVTAPETDYEFARKNNLWGIWLPEGPPAFRPFIADSHQVTFG